MQDRLWPFSIYILSDYIGKKCPFSQKVRTGFWAWHITDDVNTLNLSSERYFIKSVMWWDILLGFNLTKRIGICDLSGLKDYIII